MKACGMHHWLHYVNTSSTDCHRIYTGTLELLIEGSAPLLKASFHDIYRIAWPLGKMEHLCNRLLSKSFYILGRYGHLRLPWNIACPPHIFKHFSSLCTSSVSTFSYSVFLTGQVILQLPYQKKRFFFPKFLTALKIWVASWLRLMLVENLLKFLREEHHLEELKFLILLLLLLLNSNSTPT